jgi:ABC-type Zn uptake system ZnuABC Zn-binding protein ZnuA
MSELDTANAQTYRTNAMEQGLVIRAWDSQIEDSFRMVAETGVEIPGLITFHDGFRYFAHAYDLPLLESIEEEAGSEASAKEIVEITHLVKEHDIPVIFTEVNGSDATAKAIVRETDCAIAQLSMCMDGPDDNLNHYLNAMLGNMAAIVNGFAGEEVVTIQ